MEDKATAAYNHIDDHLPTPLHQRIRAIYQRELVRRYNGGREFRWNGTDWEILPSVQSNLPYPNQVLDTNVAYGDGNTAIAFTAASYGPLTDQVPEE